jgi:hypothetical protein
MTSGAAAAAAVACCHCGGVQEMLETWKKSAQMGRPGEPAEVSSDVARAEP